MSEPDLELGLVSVVHSDVFIEYCRAVLAAAASYSCGDELYVWGNTSHMHWCEFPNPEPGRAGWKGFGWWQLITVS